MMQIAQPPLRSNDVLCGAVCPTFYRPLIQDFDQRADSNKGERYEKLDHVV